MRKNNNDKSFTREIILEHSDAIDELIIDKLMSFFNSLISSLKKKSISKKVYATKNL